MTYNPKNKQVFHLCLLQPVKNYSRANVDSKIYYNDSVKKKKLKYND